MLSAIKILAIDNQPVYVQGLTACIGKIPAGGRVETCTGFDDLHPQMRQHSPHLVFIELNLNHHRYDGFTLCTEIKQHYKNAYVAILSRYNNPHLIDKARQCGADAYIDKGCQPEELCAFISDFYYGRLKPFHVQLSVPQPAAPLQPDAFERQQHLTRREAQLMGLIVTGKEMHDILFAMGIEYETYRYHHINLLNKMNVQNDVQLTRLVLENHLPLQSSATSRPLKTWRKAG